MYGKRRVRKGRKIRRRSATRKARGGVKRNGVRGKRYSTAKALRPKWINPISKAASAKFVYCDSGFSVTLSALGSYAGYYVFRGNSVYDPDYTGGGVQPYGYDQYMAIFNNYRVVASSIKVYFRPEPTYSTMRRLHAFVIPYLLPNPVLTDISDVRMIPNHRATTYDGYTETTNGCRMKHYLTTKRAINLYSTTDVNFQAAYNNNPTYVWYWLVYFYNEEYDDETIDIYFDVKIKYYTKLLMTSVPQES